MRGREDSEPVGAVQTCPGGRGEGLDAGCSGRASVRDEATPIISPGLEAQRQAIVERAAVRGLPDTLVRFVARKGDVVEGMAYVDTRRVRSKSQQLLVVLDSDGKVRRIEILVWQEPQRFQPKPAFLAQFHGRSLDDTLRLRRGIRPVAGATLSAQAAVDAVRSVLAAHELLARPQRGDG